MFKRLILFTIFITPAFVVSNAKPQIIPVLNFELFGGQSKFDGDTSDFNGNANWSLAPVIQYEKGAMIIPSYAGSIQRTVQVEELVGGSLLTQSQQNHNLNLKGVLPLGESAWRGKGRIGYKKNLIRETNDEGWGDGLFDNNKWVTGFEFERTGQTILSFRSGLEYFNLRYPNFQSLSSQQFGSEIEAGTDVLDLNAFDWLTSVETRFIWESFFSASFLISPRFYTDARVIQDTGLFSGDKREDYYYWLATNWNKVFGEISFFGLPMAHNMGFSLGFTRNDSNQNDFDADQTQFNDNFYTYNEWQLGPRYGFKLAKNWSFDLEYIFQLRQYDDRPVQSSIGTYTSSTITTENQFTTGRVRYNLTPAISLNLTTSHQIAKSNNKFEDVYRYNYEASHYFFGVSYAN